MSNTMIDALEAGAKWGTLTLSEQIAARAIATRLARMAIQGAAAEDWQQLAGYAEWAQHPDALKADKPTLTVAGQWYTWEGAAWTGNPQTRVDVQHRSGRVVTGLAAGSIHWAQGGAYDVVAYRIAD